MADEIVLVDFDVDLESVCDIEAITDSLSYVAMYCTFVRMPLGKLVLVTNIVAPVLGT